MALKNTCKIGHTSVIDVVFDACIAGRVQSIKKICKSLTNCGMSSSGPPNSYRTLEYTFFAAGACLSPPFPTSLQ